MISYGKQYVDKKDIQSVLKTLKSNWITQGPKIKKFESLLKKKFKSPSNFRLLTKFPLFKLGIGQLELFIGESIDISWAELISLNCCCPVLEYKVVLPKVFNSSCLSNVLCFVQKSD